MFFILTLRPASIAIIVEETLKKETKDTRSLIIGYLAYTFIITLIMNSVIFFVNSDKSLWYRPSTFTYDFCFKYGIFNCLLAIILPCIVYVIPMVIQINVEVKERQKNAKKDINNNCKNNKRKH